MKTHRIALALFVTSAVSLMAAPDSSELTNSVNTPEQLCNGNLILSPDSMAIFTTKAEPRERVAIVFERELHRSSINHNPGTLGYYFAVFDRGTGTWGKSSGGIGLPRLKQVPISARGIHIQWTGGNPSGWWLNFEPEVATVELLPRELFDSLFDKKRAKRTARR